ncbi:SIR2 family protein [Lacticaseibacillus rhamnosus]|uniref:SIR2 family protein n=1 Tax=Lacticaseibacillus rhamnosus TaxID=47715 RepID=UPI0023E22972|nr:SIR2 family protein [Lacticaseibacillus rhamnosus]MDF3335231.1 SIR2 family protein [Lacticaseibacillus rhamnosus]
MENEDFVNKYATAIIDGNAAVFAGAGLSMEQGFVDWKTLLMPFAKQIQIDLNRETDLVSIAQYYVNENRGQRGEMFDEILKQFSKTPASSSSSMGVLARLPISTYWTTNYDDQIESALRNLNKIVDVKRSEKNLAHNVPKRDAVIYKMHGDVNNVEQTVLTKSDYELYDSNYPMFRTTLKADLLSQKFLFIGFSFEDPNIEYVLSEIHGILGNGQSSHYGIFKNIQQLKGEADKDFEYRKLKFTLKLHDLTRYGIKPVLVDDYSKIPELLQRVERKIMRRNVFISGSMSKTLDKDANNQWKHSDGLKLAKTLASEIVKADKKIITGFGLGIGSAVIEGALSEIHATKPNHLSDYLDMFPFPQESDSAHRKAIWTQYRKDILKDAGIVIILFGEKLLNGKHVVANGVLEEYKLAYDAGKVIIPIGSTGWAAAKKFEESIKELRNRMDLTPEQVKILQQSLDISELVKVIMEIIERLQM